LTELILEEWLLIQLSSIENFLSWCETSKQNKQRNLFLNIHMLIQILKLSSVIRVKFITSSCSHYLSLIHYTAKLKQKQYNI